MTYRTSIACVWCRKSKTRCLNQGQKSICEACRKRDISCEYQAPDGTPLQELECASHLPKTPRPLQPLEALKTDRTTTTPKRTIAKCSECASHSSKKRRTSESQEVRSHERATASLSTADWQALVRWLLLLLVATIAEAYSSISTSRTFGRNFLSYIGQTSSIRRSIATYDSPLQP